MITQEQLKKYAELAVKMGINVQPGQEVVITAPVDSAEFARYTVEEAYKAGAKKVWVKWTDDFVSRKAMEYQSLETVQEFPDYLVEEAKYQVEKRVAFLFINSCDPKLYEGIDSKKVDLSTKTRIKNLRFSMDARSSNLCRWTIVCTPTVAWAKTIFPEAKSDKEAIDRMWDAIIKAMRLNEPDPVQAWKDHIAKLSERAKFLNDNNFEYIRVKNELGTDIKVGLVENHIWLAAGEKAQDGLDFTANMPTEEVFTAPHKYKVEGTVYSAMPLCKTGNMIDKFYLTFKDGKVVDYHAEVGNDTLTHIMETDEGSLHIGEIALIGKNSPIALQNILFYNTLYDENASCHLAIGNAYPTTIKGGNDMTPEEKDKAGLNISLNHVDFMFGTKKTEIFGIRHDGTEVQLFADGDWII